MFLAIVLAKAFDGNGVIGNGTDIVTYASTGFRSYSGEKNRFLYPMIVRVSCE